MGIDRALAARAGLCVFAAALAWLAVSQVSVVRQVAAWLDDISLAYLAEPRSAAQRIIVLAINEETLANLEFRSPINREFLAATIRELAERNVRALGIDVIFDQLTVREDDEALLGALDAFSAPVVIAYGSAASGLTPRQREFQQTFLQNRTVASIDVYTTDGVVRYLYPHGPDASQPLASFAVALAETLGIEVPASRLRLYFRTSAVGGLPAIRQFPIHTLASLPSEWFDDVVVLIGADLPNDDRYRTPLSVLGQDHVTMAGIQIHAQALAQLLEGLAYPSAGPLAVVLILLIAATIGFSVPLMTLHLGWKTALATGLLGGYWVSQFAILARGGPQLPLLEPTIGFLLGLSFSSAYERREERRQKRFLRQAFQRYVAPSIIDDVVKNPKKLVLGGETREMSFVFSDLSGFTALTERLTPDGTVALLQDYFRGMLKIALDLGGTVERMIGDSVLVFFGAPALQPDHARRAVKCVLEWDKYCERFRRDQLARGIPMGVTRIGVHTGVAVVGNVGTEQHFHYTAHGDPVNTAARLESVNRHLGTRACLSAEIASHYPEVQFRPVGRLILKGKGQAIDCVTVDDDLSPDLLAEYRSAYALMQAHDPRCVQKFGELFKKMPNDALVAFHTARLDRGDCSPIIVLGNK